MVVALQGLPKLGVVESVALVGVLAASVFAQAAFVSTFSLGGGSSTSSPT